jgi:hypothetical protein
MRYTFTTAAILTVTLAGAIHGQSPTEKERKELASHLESARVTLEQGLAAAEAHGRPISAKFEVEDGKLRLSVYTEKGDAFTELIVDHTTGKVAKTEVIKEGEDLRNARAQADATSSAKLSLRDAASRAVKANAGYRAVSVMPQLNDGSPSVDVALMKGDEHRVVTESLQ